MVEVVDNGPGIHRRWRVFQPFFTTKPRCGQRHRGLALCLTIVQEHAEVALPPGTPGGGARAPPVAASLGAERVRQAQAPPFPAGPGPCNSVAAGGSRNEDDGAGIRRIIASPIVLAARFCGTSMLARASASSSATHRPAAPSCARRRRLYTATAAASSAAAVCAVTPPGNAV